MSLKPYITETMLLVCVVFMALWPPAYGLGAFIAFGLWHGAIELLAAFKLKLQGFKELEKVQSDFVKVKADVEKLVLRSRN